MEMLMNGAGIGIAKFLLQQKKLDQKPERIVFVVEVVLQQYVHVLILYSGKEKCLQI